MTTDPAVQQRKEELVREARVTLDAIRALWVEPTRLTCPASHLPRSCRAVPGVQVRAALGSSSQAQDKALSGPDTPDPLTVPATLARAVTTGVLDAPHLRSNPFGRGQVVTRIDRRGACVAVDPATGRELSEQERIAALSIGPG